MKNLKIYNQYMYSYPHKKNYNWIDEKIIKEKIASIKNSNISLYFHIPFCSTKCGYCNLFSITDLSLIDKYVEALCRQVEQYSTIVNSKNIKISSIIFGGGTPLILSKNQFDKIFYAIEKYYNISVKDIGFDIETSPKETKPEKLKYLLEMGVNRISIGIQSFEEIEIKNIYRSHKVDDCRNALRYLNEFRPKVLNIDIIYGIPSQNESALKKSIDESLKFKPNEIFLYPLYIREGTGLFGCDDMEDIKKYKLYVFASKYLKAKGYKQTSMRRFTDTLEKENSNCGFEQSLSFGCGGRSYIDQLHFCEAYETGIKACGSIIDSYIKKRDFTSNIKGYILSEDEISRRFIIKNLGYYIGVSKKAYFNYFGKDLYLTYKKIFDELLLEEYITINEDFISLTEKGLGLCDYILPKFTFEKLQEEN